MNNSNNKIIILFVGFEKRMQKKFLFSYYTKHSIKEAVWNLFTKLPFSGLDKICNSNHASSNFNQLT